MVRWMDWSRSTTSAGVSLMMLAYEKKERRRAELLLGTPPAVALLSLCFADKSTTFDFDFSGVIVAAVSLRWKACVGGATGDDRAPAEATAPDRRGMIGLGDAWVSWEKEVASAIASAMLSKESSWIADSELGMMAPSRDMLMEALWPLDEPTSLPGGPENDPEGE